MTVIAYDGKSLAVDRRYCYGHMCYGGNKINHVGNYAVVCAGNLSDAFLFLEWFTAQSKSKKKEWPFGGEDADEHDMSALVFNKKTGELDVYSDDSNGYPERITAPFYAEGSGKMFAMAFLSTGMSAKEAVLKTADLCHTTGHGCDEVTINKESR